MENKVMTKDLLSKYKYHPRILEIRFVIFFDAFAREFGYDGARTIISALCKAFHRNETIINTIINKRFEIKRKAKASKVLWRQEVIFMGLCYNESIYKISKDYLCVTPSNFYGSRCAELYDASQFVTDAWLRNLDDEVKVTGSVPYRNEVVGMLEVLDNLRAVVTKMTPLGGD